MRSPHTATKSSPCSPQLEKSLHAATKTQRSQKINFKKKLSGIILFIISPNVPVFSFACAVLSTWNALPLLFPWLYLRSQFKHHSSANPPRLGDLARFLCHTLSVLSFPVLSALIPPMTPADPGSTELRLLLGVGRWTRDDLRT